MATKTTTLKKFLCIRPFSEKEKAVDHEKRTLHITGTHVVADVNGQPSEKFLFDDCFWLDSPDVAGDHCAMKEKVHSRLTPMLLDNVFLGHHSSLMVYGTSHSGKTFAMIGDDEDPGILPRLLSDLFERVHTTSMYKTFHGLQLLPTEVSVDVSQIAVFNNRIKDLLHEGDLWVKDHSVGDPTIEGVTVRHVKDIDQLTDCLEQGALRNATICKDLSNYSHSVTIITVTQRTGDSRTTGKLHIIDLACPIKSESEKAAPAKLTASTSCCLESLHNIVDAIQKQQGPSAIGMLCKNSVLTHLMQECFGPNSLICMVGVVSPCFADIEETLATLRYSSKTIPTLHAHLSATPSIIERLSPKTSPQISPRQSLPSPVASPRALERKKSDLERSIAVHEREIFNAKWQLEALNERLNRV
jgi:hypothetical protein